MTHIEQAFLDPSCFELCLFEQVFKGLTCSRTQLQDSWLRFLFVLASLVIHMRSVPSLETARNARVHMYMPAGYT